ncbi:ABC transporter substrate-binding protein [Bradyrhizobium septentrionale]|uniref:ABC transporter substrate-binding protein n=1 Tax=Bradyrhizobium septentrionale TaxID=1404411 RepID=A0ABZ2P4P9_9BRAD
MKKISRRKFGAIAAGTIVSPALAQNLKPIFIGVCNDQSSLFADAGGVGSVEAARMAIADFGGRALGRPVEVLSADHLNKPENAAGIVKKWIDVDGVSMLLDNNPSGPALAIQGVTKERNRIAIHVGAGTSDLTGSACSPVGFHWAYDTFSLAATTGTVATQQGGRSWFFLTADYNFGYALERDTTRFVQQNGGKVLGSVKHPLNSSDFASYLLQAQASGARVIGLANAGADTANAISQAQEFGITQGGQRLVGLLVYITTVHSLGLEKSQGLLVSESYYWDLNEGSREFGKRFFKTFQRMPTMVHAGSYSGVLHWLKAVDRAKTEATLAVAAAMREIPIQDFMTQNGTIRKDGRVIRDMHLFEVKKPSESRNAWDYYSLVKTLPGSEAFRPMSEGGCLFAT